MREKTLLALVALIDEVETIFNGIDYLNIAVKGPNQLRVEVRNQDELTDIVVAVEPRTFYLLKTVVLKKKHKCLFLKRNAHTYEETIPQLWSRVAIFNDQRTPGLRRKFMECNGRV